MAPVVEFDTQNPGSLVSYCPFEKEWKKLSDLKALDEVRNSNIIALKSSNIEYFIPKAFACVFVGVLLVLVLVVATNWPPTKLVQTPSQPADSTAASGARR